MSHFRVDRETLQYLEEALHPYLERQDTNFRRAIPVAKQIAFALKTLASTTEYLTVAALFGVGKTTVESVFKRFLKYANEVLVPRHIKWPQHSEYEERAREFESLWQFPMVVGGIDGCHFEIEAPNHLKTDYFNFKGWHSIIALVVSDARYRALYVRAGIPGRCNDSGAFKDTKLYKGLAERTLMSQHVQVIENVKVPLLLLGDSAFPLQPWLMKPFVHRGTLTEEQVGFNYRLSRARRVVENLFGRTKGRWRRILRCIQMKLENVPVLITVAICLNNICEDHSLYYDRQWELEGMHVQLGRTAPTEDSEGNDHDLPDGITVRSALLKHFSNNRLAWQ